MESETIESVESAPQSVQHRRVYELNERVLCQHTDNLFYDAKVIGITESTSGTRLYTIHYQGWSKRYDETFEESKADFRMRPFTEADFAKAKEELKAAKEKTELNRRSKRSRPKKVPKTDENQTNNAENNDNGLTKVSKDSKKSAAQRAAKALSNRAKSSKYYNRLVPKVLTKRTHPCPLEDSNGVGIKTSRAKSSTPKKRYPIGLFGSMMMNGSRRRHTINGDQYSDSDSDSDSSDGDEQQPLDEIAAKRRQRPHGLDISPHSSAHLHEQQQQRGVSDAKKPFCYFEFDNMDLPNRSKEILKIDMKMAGTGKLLPKLPARSSIAKILSEFERYMQQLNKSCGGRTSLKWKVTVLSLRECDDAIKDMFDIIVQGQLLTEKESVRHEKLLQSGIIRKDVFSTSAGSNLRPCEVYGYIHLLRFLANFCPTSSLFTIVEGVVAEALKGFTNCLNVYLANRSAHLFNVDDDYVPIKMA